MINFKEYADRLIEEWTLCLNAKPKHDAVNIKIEKTKRKNSYRGTTKWHCLRTQKQVMHTVVQF